MERVDETDIARALPRRNRSAHKGDFGRVLIIGGAPGMAGAVRLAGEACLRSGAGLVTIATAPEHVVGDCRRTAGTDLSRRAQRR